MINAYLTFNGNTEDAFNFYKSVLSGEFTNIQRYGDMPHEEGMSAKDKEKIMHIALKSSNGIIMGNDYFDFFGEPFNVGNNFSLSLHPDSEEEAKRLFNRLSEGGSVSIPLDKAPWGALFGIFTDKFGIKWLVNYQLNE